MAQTSKNKKIWSIIWEILSYILTLGLKHIADRKKRVESEETPKDENTPL